MTNPLLLALCLLAGILLRWTAKISADGHKPLNVYIIYVALPALVLQHVHSLRLEPGLLMPALMPWLVFGVGTVLFLLLLRAGVISRSTAGALILTSALGNTSFVGLPMIEAYYGKDLLGVGLMADQLGTFMCLNIPGIILAARLAAREGETAAVREIARKILFFPPFLNLVVALLLRPVEYPVWVDALLSRLGDTLTPLALVSVGLQLRLGDIGRLRRDLGLGLCYRLLAAPALALLVFGLLGGGRGSVFQATACRFRSSPCTPGSISSRSLARAALMEPWRRPAGDAFLRTGSRPSLAAGQQRRQRGANLVRHCLVPFRVRVDHVEEERLSPGAESCRGVQIDERNALLGEGLPHLGEEAGEEGGVTAFPHPRPGGERLPFPFRRGPAGRDARLEDDQEGDAPGGRDTPHLAQIGEVGVGDAARQLRQLFARLGRRRLGGAA